MNIKQIIGKILNAPIKKCGFQLTRFPSAYNYVSLQEALSRIMVKSLEIRTVIDVGASDGRWSNIVKQYYPKAFYFLIEAQQLHEKGLQSFKQQFENVDYIIAAAGDGIGDIYFDANHPFGGLASHEPVEGHCISVPLTTIDSQVKEKQLKPPFLLKLDTHGFEVPIFDGAQQTLKKKNLIIIETYNFKLTNDSLKFYEMCSFLESKGFRPIDLCDPRYRPKDKAFWQVDIFFIPSGRAEFQYNVYDI